MRPRRWPPRLWQWWYVRLGSASIGDCSATHTHLPLLGGQVAAALEEPAVATAEVLPALIQAAATAPAPRLPALLTGMWRMSLLGVGTAKARGATPALCTVVRHVPAATAPVLHTHPLARVVSARADTVADALSVAVVTLWADGDANAWAATAPFLRWLHGQPTPPPAVRAVRRTLWNGALRLAPAAPSLWGPRLVRWHRMALAAGAASAASEAAQREDDLVRLLQEHPHEGTAAALGALSADAAARATDLLACGGAGTALALARVLRLWAGRATRGHHSGAGLGAAYAAVWLLLARTAAEVAAVRAVVATLSTSSRLLVLPLLSLAQAAAEDGALAAVWPAASLRADLARAQAATAAPSVASLPEETTPPLLLRLAHLAAAADAGPSPRRAQWLRTATATAAAAAGSWPAADGLLAAAAVASLSDPDVPTRLAAIALARAVLAAQPADAGLRTHLLPALVRRGHGPCRTLAVARAVRVTQVHCVWALAAASSGAGDGATRGTGAARGDRCRGRPQPLQRRRGVAHHKQTARHAPVRCCCARVRGGARC
jgi:hypothetical protein